jgi:UDP-glucuronate decarboxylase
MRKYNGSSTALVTGGAGFLGSHLCDRLIALGHHVICADNFFTGTKDNIEHLLDHPRFELMRHDVTLPLYVEVDEIYNLACPASPVHYQHDPVQTTKTSVHGAINMLGLAKRTRARIFQASTSEVYGDPSYHPQPEGYWGNVNPIGPRSCYDEGKRCAETLFFDYHRQYGLDIRVARIFNTYGPRMHPNDGRVVSNFIVQALQGEPITVYGKGQQTRSFCFVDDLIEGFLRFMALDAPAPGPINLGNPGEFTILSLAEQVIDLTGSKSKIVYAPLPVDDPVRRRPDISLAREKLNWQPTVQLAEGLRNTITYFDKLLTRAAATQATANVKPSARRVERAAQNRGTALSA